MMPAALRTVVATEWSLVARHAKLRWSMLGVALLPALYALIYLSSVWDPNSHTNALPVALASEDAGVVYRGIQVNVGGELLAALEARHEFAYRRYPNADAARAAVRRRDALFALIVPPDFSRQATPGGEAQRGRLIVYTSEGNSYTGAGVARRFAPEVAHQVNETLNERRWALMLDTSAGSARSLKSLREGMQRLSDNAAQLAEGAHQAQRGSARVAEGARKLAADAREASAAQAQLSETGTQLTEGVRKGGQALRQLQARLPGDGELRSLRTGATVLANGEVVLGDALGQLQGGATRLADALEDFRAKSEDSLFVSGEIARGAQGAAGGARSLADGLKQAASQQEKLQAGARTLETGIYRATSGVAALGSGLAGVVGGLPEDRRLDEFMTGLRDAHRGIDGAATALATASEGALALSQGVARLDEGAAQLAGGLKLLTTVLPAETPALDGTAPTLAAPAESVLEVVAPVANNGTALAPNFVPMALWAGALMATFLFHPRRLPAQLATLPRPALWLGKLVVPAGLALAQGLIMLVMMVAAFDIRVPHVATFALTLAITSLAFLAMVYAAVKLLGDIGKVAAVLLLVLQLASAGALIPIELTTGFFQTISPWLPFTWVVRAFRATLFGAFEGDWLGPWAMIVGAGVAAVLIGALAGRWRFVPDATYGPAIDID
jgi:putative membrane protein